MMLIGWTTTTTRDEAEKLAAAAIDEGLAACCQIDGPIRSIYKWQGRVENDEEFRVTFKFLREKNDELEQWLSANHPYDTPQWLAVPAERISEKYLIWARKTAK